MELSIEALNEAMRQAVQARGDWTFYKYNTKTGESETVSRKNLIVDVGFDFICDAIGKPSARPDAMSVIGVGTGTTAAAAGNTTLVSQLVRISATYAHVAGTKVFKLTATFTPGVATGAITEAAIFNAAANGIMLNRVTFPVMNKGADDTIVAEFTFTLS